MDTPEDAATCVEQLNGTPLDGKNITVAFAKRGRARTPTPGQYHGYKLDDRRPYDGGRGGYGGGGGGAGVNELNPSQVNKLNKILRNAKFKVTHRYVQLCVKSL